MLVKGAPGIHIKAQQDCVHIVWDTLYLKVIWKLDHYQWQAKLYFHVSK